MNDSTQQDWFTISFEDDDQFIKGQKITIHTPQMEKENMLGFLAIQIQKNQKILGIRKNGVELDSKTVAELIQEVRKI
jgi:hypothetical protein